MSAVLLAVAVVAAAVQWYYLIRSGRDVKRIKAARASIEADRASIEADLASIEADMARIRAACDQLAAGLYRRPPR